MLANDLRYALRRLLKAPGFTLVAILSLALGIGANTGVFTLVNLVFWQDAGVREPDRVLQIYRLETGSDFWSISWADYRALRDDESDAFSHVTAYRPGTVRTDVTGDAVVSALGISGDYFGVMGVGPMMGRAFDPVTETDKTDPATVVIVSHDFWTGALASDPEVIGSQLRVNGRLNTVIGVLPPGFTGKAQGLDVDLFRPDPGAVASPEADNLVGGARLVPGVSMEQATAVLSRVAEVRNEARPQSRQLRYNTALESEVSVHPGIDRAMKPMAALLLGVVLLVLLIACTNLASFLLARASDRRKEFAVRKAMGAGRGRIVRQLLAEAAALSILGGAAGVFLAYASLRALLSLQPPFPISLNLDVSPDPRVLLFTLGVAIVSGVAFGLLPALQAGRGEVSPVLRDESGATTGGRSKVSLRGLLVVAQVAMSLVLLVGAGLFIRSLAAATDVHPGFDRMDVAMVKVDPGLSGYDDEATLQFYRDLQERAGALPGVRSASLGTRIPLEMGIWRVAVRRPDVEPIPGREFTFPQYAAVSPGYLETLGIDLLSGRTFTDADGPDDPKVAVLNEALARQLWPDEGDVVGRVIRVRGYGDEEVTVIGVGRTTKVASLTEAPTPYIYLPLTQEREGAVWLMARTSPGDASALAETLRAEAKAMDPDLYVHSPVTAEALSGTVLFLPRMGALLLGVFGFVALILASVGLWGIVSYNVARRQKEMGIRLSLGAAPEGVVGLVMRGGIRLALVGAGIGLLASVGAGILLTRFLFGISGLDPVTLVGVPLILVGVAALASWLPARRAAGVDPMAALRAE